MSDQKPLFKAPYDIKDVGALFAIVAFFLILAAMVGNDLFGLFQQNINFGLIIFHWISESNVVKVALNKLWRDKHTVNYYHSWWYKKFPSLI